MGIVSWLPDVLKTSDVEEHRQTFADNVRECVLRLEEGQSMTVKCCSRAPDTGPEPLFLVTFNDESINYIEG